MNEHQVGIGESTVGNTLDRKHPYIHSTDILIVPIYCIINFQTLNMTLFLSVSNKYLPIYIAARIVARPLYDGGKAMLDISQLSRLGLERGNTQHSLTR